MLNVARNGTENNFYVNNKEGTIGMNKVKNWLESHGVACQPYDLEADKQGVDIACTWGTIDVKADKLFLSTGNLTWETFSNILTRNPGWGWHETEYICFIDDNPKTKNKYSQPIMYIVRLDDMKFYYLENMKKVKHSQNLPVFDNKGEIVQQSEIALLPIRDFRRHYPLLWVLPSGTIVNIGTGEIPKPYKNMKLN